MSIAKVAIASLLVSAASAASAAIVAVNPVHQDTIQDALELSTGAGARVQVMPWESPKNWGELVVGYWEMDYPTSPNGQQMIGVIKYQLPALGAGESIDGATLDLNLAYKGGAPVDADVVLFLTTNTAVVFGDIAVAGTVVGSVPATSGLGAIPVTSASLISAIQSAYTTNGPTPTIGLRIEHPIPTTTSLFSEQKFSGGFGNTTVPTLSLSVVPEPTTLAVAGAAAGLMALRRRRAM